jgi:hypothetical protein
VAYHRFRVSYQSIGVARVSRGIDAAHGSSGDDVRRELRILKCQQRSRLVGAAGASAAQRDSDAPGEAFPGIERGFPLEALAKFCSGALKLFAGVGGGHRPRFFHSLSRQSTFPGS